MGNRLLEECNTENVKTIQALYQAFREKDYDAFRSLCTPNIQWLQNEGFPGGGHHHGADAVIEKVFKGFDTNWESFGFTIEEYLDAGSAVIVLGHYQGRHKLTGKTMTAAAAHVYDMENGKVSRFRQYTDTHMIVNAMT